MKKHLNKKNILILVLILIVLSFGFYLKMSGFLNYESLTKFIESFGMWAPLIFAIIYIIITLTGLSAAFFTILAGLIFGVKIALFVVVIAATIAATLAFYIARYLKNKITDEKDKKQNKTIKKLVNKINIACEKNGFLAIAILRLSFLPYMPLSYAAGLVEKLKARDFILATLITNIFGSFVFIFLGASLTQSIPLFLGAIVLVILFMQVPKLIKRFQK